MTDLAANEIVMNNGVLPHSSSREKSIRLEVSPLAGDDNGAPSSEYVVKFVIPEDVRGRVSDVQYVLELMGRSSDDGARTDPPAEFTLAPPNGGIGCEGRRSHASAGKEDSAAIMTINGDAAQGARLEVTAGWATGHEAVTLTEKVVLVVGQGIVNSEAGGNRRKLAVDADDDSLQDDEAEAELEESLIEEEREDLENEIEDAEEDAVEALEEKRIETEGLGSEINEAEEGVVEALEENRKHVNQVLDSLKDTIVTSQAEKRKRQMALHEHTMKQRMEAQRKHREKHDRRHPKEEKMEEMRRRFAKEYDDSRKDKLEEVMDMKETLSDSVKRMKKTDKKEHDRARREHIKQLPRAELKTDMEELKKHAKEKIAKLSDTLAVGVNELVNDPHVREIRGKLKKGLVRGSVYNGDKGKPLPPEGRHFLIVMFTLFGLVGLVRWYFDKRRKTKKGRRKL